MGNGLSCLDCALLHLVSGNEDYGIDARGIGLTEAAERRRKEKCVERVVEGLQELEQSSTKLTREIEVLQQEAIAQGRAARANKPGSRVYELATQRSRALLNKAAMKQSLLIGVQQKIATGEKVLNSLQVVDGVTDDNQFYSSVRELQSYTGIETIEARQAQHAKAAEEAHEFAEELHRAAIDVTQEMSRFQANPETLFEEHAAGVVGVRDDTDLFVALDQLEAERRTHGTAAAATAATASASAADTSARYEAVEFAYPSVDNSHPRDDSSAPAQTTRVSVRRAYEQFF